VSSKLRERLPISPVTATSSLLTYWKRSSIGRWTEICGIEIDCQISPLFDLQSSPGASIDVFSITRPCLKGFFQGDEFGSFESDIGDVSLQKVGDRLHDETVVFSLGQTRNGNGSDKSGSRQQYGKAASVSCIVA
jgi:hypothetical protein